MKIVDLELFLVPPRWLFLEISTDNDLDGWGGSPQLKVAQTELPYRTRTRPNRGYLAGSPPWDILPRWSDLDECHSGH